MGARGSRFVAVAALLAVTLLAVTLLAVTSACERKKAEPDKQQLKGIAEQIEATLAQRPDVTSVEVVYQSSLDAYAQVDVSIEVKTGADFEPAIDETLRLLWQSRLDPMHGIRIDIVDGEDLTRDDVRRVNTLNDNEKDELDAKYGKRPV